MWTDPARLAAPSAGERIAAALRHTPIYVDPAYATALPEATRAALVRAIRQGPFPIYLLVVPLVDGGQWPDPKDLATVVHDRLGRDGAFVTFDKDYPGQSFNAFQWGGTPAQQENTQDAAYAVFFYDDLRNATLGDRLMRCVKLIQAGDGRAEYERLTARLDSPSPRPAARVPRHRGSGAALPLTAAGAGAAALAGVAVWRYRRMAARRLPDHSLPLPSAVFATADRASREQLREEVGRQVVAFGELLDGSEIDTTEPRVRELMTRALDAYQAAGKVLDGARDTVDLAGALVLVDQGRAALGAARSRAAGGTEPAAPPLCFFNPLHGHAEQTLDWRPTGSRRRLRVSACAGCAAAIRARETPPPLMDRDGGRDVPYFEVDPERSVWSATGYGQFGDDLVQRVLRGDARH